MKVQSMKFMPKAAYSSRKRLGEFNFFHNLTGEKLLNRSRKKIIVKKGLLHPSRKKRPQTRKKEKINNKSDGRRKLHNSFSRIRKKEFNFETRLFGGSIIIRRNSSLKQKTDPSQKGTSSRRSGKFSRKAEKSNLFEKLSAQVKSRKFAHSTQIENLEEMSEESDGSIGIYSKQMYESFCSCSSSETSMDDKKTRLAPQTPRIKRNREVIRKKKFEEQKSKQRKKFLTLNKQTQFFSTKNLTKHKKLFSIGDYCDRKDKVGQKKNSATIRIFGGKMKNTKLPKMNYPPKTRGLVELEEENLKRVRSREPGLRKNNKKKLHFPDSKKIFRILTRGKSKPLLKKTSCLDIERVRLRRSLVDCFFEN